MLCSRRAERARVKAVAVVDPLEEPVAKEMDREATRRSRRANPVGSVGAEMSQVTRGTLVRSPKIS